uniref:Sperm associated antigen 8 n=1 Tax=Pipistrellus kuhlii TaxID=59472 RepID=A0A7J7W4K8_PIPKU|nr:sperm associated antigen 8 [Pipistrellus kuhlii]
MKTFDSTEGSGSGSGSGSLSRSLPVQPSSEASSSEVTSRSALAAARAAASAAAAATAAVSTAKAAALSAKTQAPYSERSFPSGPSSDSLVNPCPGHSFTHKIGHRRLGFKPVSYIVRHPCPTNYPNTSTVPGSSPDPVPGSRSGHFPGSRLSPVPGSSPEPVPGSISGHFPGSRSGHFPGSRSGHFPGSRSSPVPGSRPSPVPGSRSNPVPGSRSGPVSGSQSGHGPDPGHGYGSSKATGLDSRSGYVYASGPAPDNDPELSPSTLTSFRDPGANLVPNHASWNHYQCWEPRKQPWKFLPVSEPVAQRQLWKAPEAEVKCEPLSKTLPRGQCLLYNWEEERATNHLDQVPSMQDGSESFYFRHGHQGLITLQLQSPVPLSTTQKDSFQPPRIRCQPIRGKREAMLEILLCHQICKEVQAEQELTREPSEAESVTHHDYKAELVQAGDPAPAKPHDYCTEQPETFWIQKAPQLPVCEGD